MACFRGPEERARIDGKRKYRPAPAMAADAASERVAARATVLTLESIVLSSWIDLSRGAAGAHVSRRREQACRSRLRLGRSGSRRSEGRTAAVVGDNLIGGNGQLACRHRGKFANDKAPVARRGEPPRAAENQPPPV